MDATNIAVQANISTAIVGIGFVSIPIAGAKKRAMNPTANSSRGNKYFFSSVITAIFVYYLFCLKNAGMSQSPGLESLISEDENSGSEFTCWGSGSAITGFFSETIPVICGC